MTNVTHHRIVNSLSGADLGIFPGATPAEALDAMARDAGYSDYADLLEQIPGSSRDEIEVTEEAASVTSITYIYPSDSVEASPAEIIEYERRLHAALGEGFPGAVIEVDSKSLERTLVSYSGGTDDDEMTIRDIAERVWGDVGTAEATLYDYATGEGIRPATAAELAASVAAAETDGGSGVIEVDGRRCYVQA